MKKKKDPVLDYIRTFDVFPARSGSAAGAELRRRFGNQWAEDLLDAAVQLSEDREGPERFYSLKNRDLETSLFINLLLGGEVIRQGCAYFEEAVRRRLPPEEQSGKQLLDIGCENGLLTCYLAKQFPDLTVTGMDRNAAAVFCAKELAARLSLSNVSFVTGDIRDSGNTEDSPNSTAPASPGVPADSADSGGISRFDLVCSFRTLHENCPVPEDGSLSPAEYETESRKALLPFASAVYANLLPGGKYLCLERAGDPEVCYPEPPGSPDNAFPGTGSPDTDSPGTDTLMRAAVFSLRDAGFTGPENGFRTLTAKEAGETMNFYMLEMRRE